MNKQRLLRQPHAGMENSATCGITATGDPTLYVLQSVCLVTGGSETAVDPQ